MDFLTSLPWRRVLFAAARSSTTDICSVVENFAAARKLEEERGIPRRGYKYCQPRRRVLFFAARSSITDICSVVEDFAVAIITRRHGEEVKRQAEFLAAETSISRRGEILQNGTSTHVPSFACCDNLCYKKEIICKSKGQY